MNKNQTLWTKDFLLIAGGNFFVFLAFYIFLVTLPVYAIKEFHSSNANAGLLTTVFLVSAIVTRPFAGYWLERFGKKRTLISALIIFSGASCLYFFPNSLSTLLLLRLLHGIGFGMSTTATGAIVADILPDSRRGEGMGYFVLSNNVAMVVGPFIGLTIINQFTTSMLFTVCLISSGLALICGFGIKLPKQKSSVVPSFQLKNLFERSAIPISILGSLLGLVYASILSFVSVFAVEVGLVELSSWFFVVYALVLLLSRPFTGKWFDLYGENWIIYPALFCFAVGMYVLGSVHSAFVFILAAALIGLGWGTASPSFQTIAVQYAKPKQRGMATATYLSIFDIGIGVGSYVAGLAINEIGFHQIYQSSSIIILLGIVIYYMIHGRNMTAYRKKVQSH
ncbi:MFS transporter [Bacillus sp. T3]|uniref:MFS transporter n=1 Tax=Bacillus sp. T3 TaxID=467262 RepID=UPI0029813003|nr:MFS transporter [Bacillus sp. T3]